MAGFDGYGAVPIDFSGIGSIPETYTRARQGATRERVLSDLGKGTLDYGKASQALLAAGDTEGGLSLARLAEARSNRGEDRAFRQQESARAQSNADRSYGLQERQFTANLEGQKIPAGFEPNPDVPGALRPRLGGSADPEYIKRASEAKVGNGLFDQDTLSQLAEQYRAGDTSVMTNLGRGAQGAENIKALRQEIVRQNTGAGTSGADQAQRNAEMFGQKAGQRTLGTRTANMELAVSEAQKLAPLVIETSNAVDRTKYPKLNDLIMAAEKGTGDENTVRYSAALNSFVNVYSRAISPTGVPTVHDKEHARDILQRGYSKGQVNAAVDQLMKEMAAARQAPGDVKQQMRDAATGREPSGGSVPQFKSPAEVQRMIQTGKLRSGDKFRDSDGNERVIP